MTNWELLDLVTFLRPHNWKWRLAPLGAPLGIKTKRRLWPSEVISGNNDYTLL